MDSESQHVGGTDAPTPPTPPVGQRPRQPRAKQTQRRVFEAAIAEYERVGVEAARVEDIVAAAGVSWGTFFHYFPRKEDVLLEASVEICAAFADAIDRGIAERLPTAATATIAFRSLRTGTPYSPALQIAALREATGHPGRLTAYVKGRTPSPVEAVTRLLAEGQRRGEIRDDEPAASLAVVLVYGVMMSANREAALGSPAGTGDTRPSGDVPTPLGQVALDVILRGLMPWRALSDPVLSDPALSDPAARADAAEREAGRHA